MSDWQIFVALGMGAAAVGFLYNIFLEVRSIRRMVFDRHERDGLFEVNDSGD
ncbi:hypothetical protein [Phenylobacterium sp.]|uniref:hypothetical protein n=1 Tax=Phenylobacterium sp. TaxID=1871053 RepID=UPI00286C69A8|nr:hypothetical protein [Phenylobacterium sp.]